MGHRLGIPLRNAYEYDIQEWTRNPVMRTKDMRWDIGIAFNLLFTFRHNIYLGRNLIPKIAPVLPLPQFIIGAYYWNLMRTRGFDHAVLAHSVHNLTVGPIIRTIDSIAGRLGLR